MNSSYPQPWQIWHARFDFDNNKGYKYRPIIILNVKENGSIVAMITSATNKLKLEHDYLIQDWEKAGLVNQSIARLDRIAEIPTKYLGSAGYIGTLSLRDINAIKIILYEII